MINSLRNIVGLDVELAFEVDVRCITCDLSSSDSVGQIYNFCNEHLLSVGFIVNNAGYAISTAFHDTPVEEEEAFLRVLGVSVVSLTKVLSLIEAG